VVPERTSILAVRIVVVFVGADGDEVFCPAVPGSVTLMSISDIFHIYQRRSRCLLYDPCKCVAVGLSLPIFMNRTTVSRPCLTTNVGPGEMPSYPTIAAGPSSGYTCEV
jgi:hypothetical protein